MMTALKFPKETPKPERVLVAQGIAGVVILVARGSSIEQDIGDGGLYYPADLGLDEPDGDPGLYVIEFVSVWRPGVWEHPDEGEMYREQQKVRDLTELEWRALESGTDILFELWGDIESYAEWHSRTRTEQTK